MCVAVNRFSTSVKSRFTNLQSVARFAMSWIKGLVEKKGADPKAEALIERWQAGMTAAKQSLKRTSKWASVCVCNYV